MSAPGRRRTSALGGLVTSFAKLVGGSLVVGGGGALVLLPIVLLIGCIANLFQVGVIAYEAATGTLPAATNGFFVLLALKVVGIFVGMLGAVMGWLGMFF